MTEQVKGATKGAAGLADGLPTDRLLREVQDLVAALGERAVGRVSEKLEGATERLTDYAEHGGPGLASALSGGRDLAKGKLPVKSMVGAGIGKAKEKVGEVVKPGGGDGGEGSGQGGKLKVTTIVESVEVGVPVSVAYNQWTTFEDYPTFMKKVENVKQESETELKWKAQVFLSHRAWTSSVIEQVPDERIVWESTGEKGHVDGAVTFHEVTPDLTKILLVLEYHPKGFFEQTGNLWRAQGRRARLELKHFQRHVMTESILHQEDVRGWRGEVADGEVVRTDEEVREEEAGEGREDERAEEAAEDEGADEDVDEADEAGEDEEEDAGDGEDR
jgi:hypothetical protein